VVAPPLSELVAPEHTALLFQEVQEGVIGKTATLVELADAAAAVELEDRAIEISGAARAAGVPVVHCTAAHLPGKFGANRNARLFAAADKLGSLGEADQPSVAPLEGVCSEGDVVLPRFHGLSPMSGTQLDSLLRNAGVTTVVVCGVSLNVAIPNLVFDAVNRAYQVVVVEDAVVGVPLTYGSEVLVHTIRPLARLASCAEIVAAWRSSAPGPALSPS
jgi:nicotinamidase-related amidase